MATIQIQSTLIMPRPSIRSTIAYSLEKLHSYGIRGKLLTWLSNYLNDRPQIVAINGAKSHPSTVKSDVPQGTVLGPVLFILYLNDLTKCIQHSVISSFADDTRLQKEICNMTLHINKFEYLCHSSGSSKLLQELQNSSVLRVHYQGWNKHKPYHHCP